ncbi:MAG: hypothetical protein H7Y10_12115 [Flavobacterium sp.]|nr:hypothetical protein [Flavobacterium sp.]
MSNDIIHSKIELLEDQIENIERSGHFTEKEIDRLAAPMRSELAILKAHIPLYGMTPESYNQGKKIHQKFFKHLGFSAPTRHNIFDMVSISKG